MRYRAFRTKNDNKFYFQFLSDNGDVLLRSQAYDGKEACFNGIKSVISNAGEEGRYERATNNDGQHYFILKAANGQEIGRSEAYDSEADVTQAMATFIAEAPNASSRTKEEGGGAERVTAGNQSDSPGDATDELPYEEGARGTDNYKPLAFYESRISGVEDGFDNFHDEDENEYYFTYNLDKLVVLISEGYQSENSRNNGIQSVTNNMTNADRYQRKVHPNGKHYFNLRAGNNQEIATSRWFDNEGQMNDVMDMLTSNIGAAGGRFARALGLATDDDALYFDYKRLAFYQERIKGEDFGYDPFDEDGKYYFTVNYEGQPVLISETYESADGRDNGIQSVKRNVKLEKRYVRKVHPNGMHYFSLLAGNKQEIATSRWFEDKKEMERMIRWLLGTGGTRRRKKAKRTKVAAERRYVKQNIAYPCSDISYDTFQSGGNERYYFVFKNKEDKAVLINGNVRGFADEAELGKTIDAVFKFALEKDNYELKTTKNGKFYFYIKDDKGNSIARSSLFYDTEAALQSDIDLLACGAKVAAAPAPMVAAGPGDSKIIDDYLPCEDYSAPTDGFHKFRRDDRNDYYFSFIGDDGKVLLRSEAYTTQAARDNGIQSVIKNAPIAERWKKESALNGRYHYYALRAGNNQEIARSCYYESEDEMLAALAWLQGDDSPIGFGAANLVPATMLAAAANKKAEEEEAARLAAARLKEEEERKAAAIAAAAAVPVVAKSETVYKEEKSSGLGWLWWLLPLLLLALLAFFLMRGCDGCKKEVPPPPPPPVDTTEVITEPEVIEPFGPDGAALGFAEGTVPYEIANYLSDGHSTFPRTFGLTGIDFPRNSASLNRDGRALLDDIANILKQYPGAQIDIYGYIGENERSAYRGSKELTLDDVRARNIYNYLKSKGVDESKMNFSGNGVNDANDAELVIRGR